jgi:indole-3-glycerol phosphate synthase
VTILDQIIQYKREEEVPACLLQVSMPEMQRRAARVSMQLRSLSTALKRSSEVGLIAEVKKASPSKGVLCGNFDPMGLAATYYENGAAAISVVTDEPYFQGSLEYLVLIRQMGLDIPLLRKDFIVHPYQVYQSRAAGADAVLLIAAALPLNELSALHALVLGLGMEAIVEVHNDAELTQAMQLAPRIIGVNNRNLHTFIVDLDTCIILRSRVPTSVCFVAESGIHTAAEMQRLHAAGVDAALVGEALVVAQDVGDKVKELIDGGKS